MKSLLLVAFGGAAGALARWGVAAGIDLAARGSRFPWGVFAVNLAGCVAIGLLYGLAETRAWLSDVGRWLLMVGFLGSFTTFSAFSLDALTLWERGAFREAALYVLGSVILSLAAAAVGLMVTRAG